MKGVKKILFVLMAIALFASLNELAFKNDVFAKSMALCCNNGMCHDMDCSMSSSVSTWASDCTDYMTTCLICISRANGNQLCGYRGPKPTYCWNGDEKWDGSP